MYQQNVKGKKLSPLAGAGLIVLIVLSVMAAGFLEQVVALMTGSSLGSLVVWALVGVEAFFIFRLNTREYRYTVAEGRLFIESRYGNHVRTLFDIPLKDILAIGPEEAVFQEYGNGQSYDKVYVRSCAIARSALAYRKGEATRLLSFQPDEKMLEILKDAATPSA